MSDFVIAIIPARIDSSRFPAKMIADASGKPLIQHTWEVASAAKCVSQVCIATDSSEISQIVRAFGGEVLMTGEHPNGTSRIAEAVRDIDCDVVVNLQGDEPELDPTVIDATVAVLRDCSMATAACPLEPDEIDNENVVKVMIDPENIAIDFARLTDDATAMRHIGLYVYKPAFLQTYVSMQPTQNELARRLEQMRAVDNGFDIAIACVDPQPSGIDTKEQYDAFVARVN
jgi:3-deoxy-manno-octulosonate cytidylyltransferase (CMP-KDO synthetase)